jgi:hypothetical protein
MNMNHLVTTITLQLQVTPTELKWLCDLIKAGMGDDPKHKPLNNVNNAVYVTGREFLNFVKEQVK